MVVTVPYSYNSLTYRIDSPDSSYIQAFAFLIGKVWQYGLL